MKTLQFLTSTIILTLILYSCNKNEFAPEIIDQEFTVVENSPSGTIIGTVDASDADEGQIISFEIIEGNLEGTFEIDPDNGILSIADPGKLDYEENMQFILKIAVTDNHDKEPLESSATIKINVTDKNEFSPVVNDQSFNLDENPSNGKEIGTIQSTDEDTHQSRIYSIIANNENNYFQIDSQTGTLSVMDSSGFDFESNQELSVLVQVEDNHMNSLTDSAYITVKILDVLEISDGLTAYYPFNGNADDESGNNLHGQISGPVLTEDKNLQQNNAYLFDGIDDYISIGSDFDFQEKSISLFFYANTVPIYDYETNPETSWFSLFTIDHPGLQYGGMRLCLSNVDGLDMIWFWKNRMESIINPNILSTKFHKLQWNHVTVTISAESIKLYTNGNFVNTYQTNITEHSVDGVPHMVIGSSRSENSRFFDGIIDEIYIHDRILEDWEITNLYQMKCK